MNEKKYPIGIQTFSRIRREGLVYVDKTDLVWQMVHYATYVFLSRPRRFGKSLLTTTLDSYFRGEKELFEGLKIMPLEKDWQQYPVINLSLSMAKNQDSSDALRDRLLLLKPYKEMYGSDPEEKTPGGVLAGLISRACKKTGKQVVVLIDEYDAPLLEALHEKEMLAPMRKMQAYLSGIPYVEGFKKKLEAAATAEGFYEYTLYLIFSTLNFYVRTQVKCAGGRVDMVVWMPDAIYVFELKVNGTAQDALRQIDSHDYAIPYQTDGRRVVKVGVKFDGEKRVPEDWAISDNLCDK